MIDLFYMDDVPIQSKMFRYSTQSGLIAIEHRKFLKPTTATLTEMAIL